MTTFAPSIFCCFSTLTVRDVCFSYSLMYVLDTFQKEREIKRYYNKIEEMAQKIREGK